RAGYYGIYNVCSGITYEWSYCTADGGSGASASNDLRLNLFNNASNAYITCSGDYGCTPTQAPKITWTATFTGAVRVLTSQYISSSQPCLSNTTNVTLAYRKTSSSPPNNDVCSSSAAISLTPSSSCNPTAGDICGATETYNPSTCSGSTSNVAQDVWFKFIATSASHSIIVDPSTGLDAVIGLYSSCSSGSLISCIDNGGGEGNIETLTYSSFTVGNTYYVRVYDYIGGAPTTTDFTICVTTSCTPITSVTQQPQSQSICSGNPATLTAEGNGSTPHTYQWYSTTSGLLSGETNSSYTTSTAGSYYCIIKNCSGANQVTSSTAILTVTPSPVTPVIAAQGGVTSFCQGNSTTLQVTNSGSCSSCTWTWSNGSSGQSISVNSAGTYYCTSSNACPGNSPQSNQIQITVTPAPTTPVITAQGGITSFCQGTGSTTLLVSTPCTGCTYSWSPTGSGTSISVTTAGTYYCTASNSCPGTSSPSNSIVITINTAPTVSFSQYSSDGLNYNFTDNSYSNPSPISWLWNFGDGGTSTQQSPSHTYANNSTYNVSLQVCNICGCNSTSHSVSINEYQVLNIKNITIIPNPISKSALINFTVVKPEKISINLYDMIGKKVTAISESEYNPGEYSISFERPTNLPSGTYFIKFDIDNSSEKFKVVFN
ncbi:MAG: PKD domain-containing protein, partial [Bacteroidota bacterium]